MKVAIINIRSVKLHTMEPIRTATDGDDGEMDASDTMNTNVYTTITYPVSVQFFEASAPDPLNDEAFRVAVVQPMDGTPVQPLSKLIEDGGLVVGNVLAHVMDASTAELPPPPTLIQLIPVPLPHPPLPHIPALYTLSTHRYSPGEITTTRPHSTGKKADCHKRKWFEDHYGDKQKINVPHTL